jgi:HK97 gp10 family phage protein
MARTNQSVERFRKLTQDLMKEVLDEAVKELNDQGDALVQAMISVAPEDEGNLQHSVRKIPGKKITQIRIMAGGVLTTRPSVSSKPFDYARADEFGTQKMAPKPFFFPTYRLKKKKMISAMKRKITASIKKRSAE